MGTEVEVEKAKGEKMTDEENKQLKAFWLLVAIVIGVLVLVGAF